MPVINIWPQISLLQSIIMAWLQEQRFRWALHDCYEVLVHWYRRQVNDSQVCTGRLKVEWCMTNSLNHRFMYCGPSMWDVGCKVLWSLMAELSIEVCYLCDNVFQQHGFTEQTEAVILVSLEKIVIYLFSLPWSKAFQQISVLWEENIKVILLNWNVFLGRQNIIIPDTPCHRTVVNKLVLLSMNIEKDLDKKKTLGFVLF